MLRGKGKEEYSLAAGYLYISFSFAVFSVSRTNHMHDLQKNSRANLFTGLGGLGCALAFLPFLNAVQPPSKKSRILRRLASNS